MKVGVALSDDLRAARGQRHPRRLCAAAPPASPQVPLFECGRPLVNRAQEFLVSGHARPAGNAHPTIVLY
jgi:hypothetical protein